MGFELSKTQIDTDIKPIVIRQTTLPIFHADRQEKKGTPEGAVASNKTTVSPPPPEQTRKTGATELTFNRSKPPEKPKPVYDHTSDLAELAAGFLCVINGLEPAGQLANPLKDEMGLLPVAAG